MYENVQYGSVTASDGIGFRGGAVTATFVPLNRATKHSIEGVYKRAHRSEEAHTGGGVDNTWQHENEKNKSRLPTYVGAWKVIQIGKSCVEEPT